MNHIKGEPLNQGEYMGWLYEGKNASSAVALQYFENKYGYMPTEVIIGKEIDKEEILDWGLSHPLRASGKAQPKHILLR